MGPFEGHLSTYFAAKIVTQFGVFWPKNCQFWLYVEIYALFVSVVLKKNDVLKGPIWRYAWFKGK